jgi:predicted RND superfamily exporter protein
VNEESGVLRNSPEVAMTRLQGTLFGPDGKQTCIFLTLSDVARNDLHQVCGRGMLGKPLGRLYEIASESGLTANDLRMGGPPIDNVAIDEEGTITLVRLVGLSVLLGLGLSYACFRTITATMMVFFVGGVSAVMSVAFVWWFGSSMDAIMMSMPSLVYVLGLSGSVHLMNYYQQAVDEHGLHGAAERAVAHAWKPAILCNITTAIGLVSLYTSEIVPIRKFGMFSAIAVMAMLLVVFTYLPAALQIWPQVPKRKIDPEEQSWLEKMLAGFWHVIGKWIIDHHNFVAFTCTILIAMVGYGVMNIQTSVNLLKMFDPSAKIIGDYQWLEEKLGRLVPMEIVLKVDKDNLASTQSVMDGSESSNNETASTDTRALETAKEKAIQDLLKLNFLSRMELTSRVQQVIEQEFGPEGSDEVGRAMSAATFAPVLPGVKNDLSTFSERRATNKKLDEHRADFLASDYVRLDRETQAELWRISVRLAASKKVDYGNFVQNLKQVVSPVLAAYSNRETVIRSIAERKFAAAVAASQGSAATETLDVAGVPKAVNPALSSVLILGKPTAGALAATSHRIQLQTLSDLLATSRMKVEVPKEDATLDAEKLGKYSCVLFIGDIDSSTRQLAEQSAQQVLDLNAEPTVTNTTNLAAVYTGVVPIVYKAQRALLDSLVESTFWSFVTITPLMMWVSRSIGAGLVTMLPNVLPVFVIFGAMGWLGIEVDVGSMMTASIALGVAVDDTIHYLSWFREELDKCGDRKTAILRTYERCATPTFQAALISGLGLSIFAFSTFTPTQRFGYLMLTILWAGVVSELIYFPALLAGPLGWVFKPRQTAAPHAEQEPTLEAEPTHPSTATSEETSDKEVVKFPVIKPHLVRHDTSHGSAKKRSS